MVVQKTVKDIYTAVVEFISQNSSFESNEAIDETIKKIEQVQSMEDFFRIPIENRLFNFTKSLQWLYFICFIIRVINDEHIIIPSAFNASFSSNDAMTYLSNKYSLANESFYRDYFNDSDDD